MKQQLETILNNAEQDLKKATSINDIEEIKLKYLSRKGELNSIKKNLKDLSDEDKRVVGAFANEVAQKLESSVKEKFESIYRKELDEKLQTEKIDITLPGKFISQGKVHPLTSTTNEIVAIFQTLGFSLVKSENSPEVETEHFNFDMLNFPQDHPAKDMQDTFYTKVAPNVILRSQTSTAQIREMETNKPPLRVIAPGRVYRSASLLSPINFSRYPVREVEFVKINNIKGNLLVNFGLGSYAAYKLYPQNKIFMDGRYEEVFYDYMVPLLKKFYLVNPGWDEVIKKFPTDVMIIETYYPIYSILKSKKEWTLIFVGEQYGVFIKTKDLKKSYKIPSYDSKYYQKTLFDTDLNFVLQSNHG